MTVEQPALRRTLSLPLLVFYGVGVTVGAGVFALVGEILGIAGDLAPAAFLLAGLIAGATGLSYAVLVRVFPRAGGEAVFVNRGLGPVFGWLAGFGVVATGVVSSAVISLSFAGYVNAIVPVPQPILVVALVAVLALVAWWGVRESVIAAAVVTVLEVGALLVVCLFGLPLLGELPDKLPALVPTLETAALLPLVSAAVLAFFAFIGFEDIVNMAEETRDPAHTTPRAILITLAITIVIYMFVALIAVLAPQRAQIAGSQAPLADLFALVSGLDPTPITVIAALAMVNGILIQIVMAARVLYGMANEDLLHPVFARVGPWRRTPVVATATVAVVVVVLALFFPLVGLAQATSLITLGVFTLINLALFRLGRRHDDRLVRRFRYWGLASAALCVAIAGVQLSSGLVGGH